MRKLSDEQLQSVYDGINSGLSNREIFRRTGIARNTVRRIRSTPRGELYLSGRKAKMATQKAVKVRGDLGAKIPGSKMFRGYCIRCGEPIRVMHKQNAATSLGTCCNGGSGSQRNLGQAEDYCGETGGFF